MKILEFRKIKKSFGKKKILKEVSFFVNEGEIFGLIGESGGGKSTLFSILTGFLEADSGEIFFKGERVQKRSPDFIANIGFASQDDRLVEELSIKENCFYFGALMNIRKAQIEKKMNELLPVLKLEGAQNTLVKNLSGGMAKRANILVSLIHNPSILVLDEPTTGLDPLLRTVFWKHICEIKNKTKTTVLVASHLLDEIEENCDRIAVLKDGRIAVEGNPQSFKALYNKEFREAFEEILKKGDGEIEK